MKRIILIICLLVFTGCSPMMIYNARMERMRNFMYTELSKPQYANIIEKDRALWNKAAQEFPESKPRIDYIVGLLDNISTKQLVGLDTSSDWGYYNNEAQRFWEDENTRAYNAQMNFRAIGQGFQQGYQQGYQYQQPNPNRMNCISNTIGNQLYTNCY